MKREKNEEVRSLRDELKKMEEWKNGKDYYKNNFSQAEDRANDEEQEYRAEAEAFEKLRNEYNTNVVELENLEKDKIEVICIPKGGGKDHISNHGQRLLNFHPGREVSFMKFVLLAGTATTVIGKHGWLLVLQINQTWMH